MHSTMFSQFRSDKKIMPTPTQEYAIETSKLCKRFRDDKAPVVNDVLKNISLRIPKGSFFGLLGPNGAGKSTLINILAGLVKKTSGTARVWGYDIIKDMRQARRAIGVVPQELNIDPFFTPREMLDLQAGLYGVRKGDRFTEKILETVGLADKADAYARTLSGGMRRRLLVGKAMVHRPPVLVLDEPSAGVDVDLRRQLWDQVKTMNRQGVTVLLTTHYLEEAEAMCDTIAIINHGAVIACEPTKDLLKRLDHKEMTVTITTTVSKIPEALKPFAPCLLDKQTLRFSFLPSHTPAGQILASITESGLVIKDVKTKEVDLEDIFLRLTS